VSSLHRLHCPLHVLYILHPPYGGQGPRLLIDLEAARLGLYRTQHGVEGLPLEERMFLVGDEGADEGVFLEHHLLQAHPLAQPVYGGGWLA